MKRRHRTRTSEADKESDDGGSGSDDLLLSDTADCSLLPPSNNTTINTIATMASSWGKKKKSNDGNVNESSNNNNMAPLSKTLFSTVMSRSTTNSTTTNNNTDRDIYTLKKSSNVTFVKNKVVTTPTQNLLGGKKHWQNKSPMNSPGGYEILKALDDVNLYAYQASEREGENDVLDGNDVQSAEEWHDAIVHFNSDDNMFSGDVNDGPLLSYRPSRNNNNNKAKANLTDIMNAEKEVGQHDHLHHSSIVEATRPSFGDEHEQQQQQIMNIPTSTCPVNEDDPCKVGFMDWSLKRRIRLECAPGRCLPESLMSSNTNEGSVHHLALQYLSNGRRGEGARISQQKDSSMEELASAKWLASTMYYQHPAVHPLPPSLLLSSDSEKSGNNTRQGGDLSSFLIGPNSIHNRARLPAAGCMGGLGASKSLDKGDKPGGLDRRMNNTKQPTTAATVSTLLDQRRHEWQEAFRSMFQSWKSKLKNLDKNSCADDGVPSLSSGSVPSTEDDLSRCSFYLILPHQVILFRGGYAERSNGGNFQRSHDCLTTKQAKHCIVPMIVFSSTSVSLRSKLRSMGADLMLFAQNDDANGKSRHDIFSESIFDTEDAHASTERDAESVHAELAAIKQADDEKGKVTVEVKKKKQQTKHHDPSGSTNFPPLFVSGDDDCAAVYELLMNTYGLSINLDTDQSSSRTNRSTVPSTADDVPLLLCRSLGPCMHTTLRTLSTSSRRDCGYMNQTDTNSSSKMTSQNQQQSSTTARASLELRGPILPCALRDLTCSMVNFMLLDEHKHGQQQSNKPLDNSEYDESNTTNNMGTGSHQFAMFLQAHEGECSISAPKSTGSSSSTGFNGSNVPLLPGKEDHADESTTCYECRYGDVINVLVWDISRKSVVSFHPFRAMH